MFDLENFMSPEEVNTIKTAGLNRIVGVMEKQAGRDVEEIDLGAAVSLLGQKIYEKRAQHDAIRNGIKAFSALQES